MSMGSSASRTCRGLPPWRSEKLTVGLVAQLEASEERHAPITSGAAWTLTADVYSTEAMGTERLKPGMPSRALACSATSAGAPALESQLIGESARELGHCTWMDMFRLAELRASLAVPLAPRSLVSMAAVAARASCWTAEVICAPAAAELGLPAESS